MRLVLDTNVLISAFVFPGGIPEVVWRLGVEGDVELVTSPALLTEFGRILTEKFDWEPSMAEHAVKHVATVAAVVRPKRRVQAVIDDPSDDRVLEAATEGRAELVVSGDRHLLNLGSWEGTEILAPGPFVDSIGV